MSIRATLVVSALLLVSPVAAQGGALVLQMDKILPPASGSAFSSGGSGVAFDGTTLVVGYASQRTLEVYELGAAGWMHVDTLSTPDPTATAFPGSFDVDGDVLVSGARGGGAGDRVFVWRNVGGAWTFEEELDPGVTGFGVSGFGYAQPGIEVVKVADGRIAVGATGLPSGPPANIVGTVFVFEHGASGWAPAHRLGTATAGESRFGAAVDFDGERIIVGDPDGQWNGAAYGRAHIFEEQAGTWVETGVISTNAPTPWVTATMGYSVAIDGEVAAVGTGRDVGEAEIYELDGGTWTHRRRVRASGGARYFSADLEVEGSLVFVGARSRQGASAHPQSEGRVYVFSDDGNQWNEAAQIEAFDKFDGQGFGANLAVTDRSFVVAAPGTVGGLPGAVYGAEYCPLLGTSYCTANVNSSGFAARICAGGSDVRGDEDLRLFAHYVPQSSFGYFLMSEGQDFIPNFAGSQGNLCLGGGQPLYRFSLFVLQSPGVGTVHLDLPWNLLPAGAQPAAGETWNFQYWFRDANPGVTSNTSDALSVLLR